MLKNGMEPIQKPSVKNQYLAGLVVNLLTIGYGITCGWASPSILILTSDESPLPTGKISMTEASWIASISCIGGLIGNIIFGFITSRFGRKIPLLFLAAPTIAGWLLVLFAQNVYYLYTARLLLGSVGGGLFVLIPLFVTEIAHDSVRGTCGSFLILTANLGVLLAFILGHYFDYTTTPKFVIALTLLFGALFISFPESPSFLIKKNNKKKAVKAVQFYQSIYGMDVEYMIVQEMNKLESVLEQPEKAERNSFNWSDLMVNPGKKALLIGIGLSVLNQFCGCLAMLYYTATIFKDAGSTMEPNSAAIVVGSIQFFGSFITTNLIDRAGRKFLYIVSTIGTAFGLGTLGTYVLLKSWDYDVEAYNWIPIVSFSFVVFVAALAVMSLPFVVISEIMPERLKDFGASFCMTLIWSFAFIAVKYLPILTETVGFAGTMYLFAGVCLSSSVLIILFLPETKGKSYEQIMHILQ